MKNPLMPLQILGLALILALSPPVGADTGEQDEVSITFDGSMDDWPAGLEATADAHWIYFRYDARQLVSLQNGPVMTVLQIDLDENEKTGMASDNGALGIDLEITMTTLDQRDPTRLGGGVEINTFSPGGQHESLTHAKIGLSYLPTYASKSFEIRIARAIDGPDWIRAMARSTDAIRYQFINRDEQYMTKWSSGVRTLSLPPIAPGRELFDVSIPSKADDSIRIVSWNVLWGTPSKEPDGFARVLRTLDPDVILFQEWDHGYWTGDDRIPKRDYIDWLNTHLDQGKWSIRLGAERGVLVASRFQLDPFLPEKIGIAANRSAGIKRSRVVRCASARVETPLGEVGAVSIHLKSRGGLGSTEDRIRVAEITAVHDAIAEALSEQKPDFLVVSGDWNLVGGHTPVDRAVVGLDLEGSDLLVVEPRRLGAGDAISWRDQRSHFAPGRLDYALVADDGVEVAQTFILDTTLLTDATLRQSGLERTDTDGSDHLPVVIDLHRTGQD